LSSDINKLREVLEQHQLTEGLELLDRLAQVQRMHELKDGLVHSIEKSFHQAAKYKDQEKWNDAVAHLCTAVQKLKHAVIPKQ